MPPKSSYSKKQEKEREKTRHVPTDNRYLYTTHVPKDDLLSEDEEVPSGEHTENTNPQDLQPTDEKRLHLTSSCKPLLKIGQSYLCVLDFIIIINLFITAVISLDFINRQINVSASTPDERLSSVEYRIQRIENVNSKSVEMKKRLDYLESDFNDAERRMFIVKSEVEEIKTVVKSEVEKIKTVDLPGITVQITSQTEDIKEILPLKAELKTALQQYKDAHGLQEIVNDLQSKLEGFEDEVKTSISSSKETKHFVEVNMKKFEERLNETKDSGSKIDEDDPLMQKVWQLESDVKDVNAKTEKYASSAADVLSLTKDMDGIRSVLRRKVSSQETNMENLVTSFAENFETRDGVDLRMVEFNDSLTVIWGQIVVEASSELEKRINSTINETTESVFVKMEKRVESAVSELTTVTNKRIIELSKNLENTKLEMQNNLTRLNETRDGVDQIIVDLNRSLNRTWNQKLVEESSLLEKRINLTINETAEGVLVNIDKRMELTNRSLTSVINGRTTELNESLVNAKLEMQNDMVTFKGAVYTDLTNVRELINVDIKLVETKVDDLEKKFDDNTKIMVEKLENNNDAHRNEISSVRSDITQFTNDLNGKIETTKDQLQDGISDIKKVQDTLREAQTTLKGQADVTRETSLSIETSILLFFVIGILFIVLFVLVLTKKDTPKLEHSAFREDSTLLPKYRPNASILDKIQRRQLLDEICVVSFYTETQTLHKRLANSAFQKGKIDVKMAYCGNHDRILELPPSKIFLIFVDFNERNIILEDPNRELGDLKRTTVQAAKKIGGDVFVIYVRDVGSKVLPDGQLFNTKLTSIYQHAELSSLNQQNRVLTTFEEFNSYQKEHLSKSISQTLKVKT